MLRNILIKSVKKVSNSLTVFYTKVKRKVNTKIQKWEVEKKRYKTMEMSVSDLLHIHSRNGELLRCDIVVRYLAIEENYGKNDYGFSLYAKMQNARKRDGYAEKSIKQFKDLMNSYEEIGYDRKSGILVDKNLCLLDGSHRVAMALYHGIDNITVNIVSFEQSVDYKIDWFIMNGFTTDEVRLIIEKYKELLENNNKPFSCVIWSPAVKYAKDIIEDLKVYGEIVRVKEYEFKQGQYENIVRAIYRIDDIESWKVDKKLDHMRNSKPRIIEVDVRFSDPQYRLKNATGLPLSTVGERVKRAIRTKYKNLVEDYFFDIILHIGDNTYQSEYMRNVFENNIDFTKVIDVLNKYEYAFTKVDVPYMTDDFPKTIPYGKDADIYCMKKDIRKISEEVIEVCKKYDDRYNITTETGEKGLRIRILWGGVLIYQVDLAFSIEDVGDGFIEDALFTREKKNLLFILNRKYEYANRALSFRHNTRKKHHKEYLRMNADDYDENLFMKYGIAKVEDLI